MNQKYKSTIGFIDLLFNILVGFAFLFIVAFILIKPESKKKDFERRAEYIVVLEWDKGVPDDLDLYVRDPLGGLVSFRYPRVNFSHLDKDDLGSRNDSVIMSDGTLKTIPINREVVTIRGIIPGEWVINAHYYSSYNLNRTKKKALNVKVELHKVNPYGILGIWEKKYHRKGQEETFVRFTIDTDGEMVGSFRYLNKKFVLPNGITGNSDVSRGW